MIDFINSWIQGIIIAVVISTIIEMILPNGTIKKYVRTVIGAYIVFVIISPIITKITGKEISLGSFKLPEMEVSTQATIDTNSYVESTYINTIKQDIIGNIQEKGYKVENLTIDIEKENEKYGEIKKIELLISRAEEQTGNIKPVEININNKVKEETISREELQVLKEYLKENYGASEILINSTIKNI